MRIEHQELCSLIPHDGLMCLLDSVEYWDEKRIVCSSRTHMHDDNPLRSDDRLAAIHGVEYAAQAMAVHGGLLAHEKGETGPGGFLAALRGVSLNVDRLDTISAPLHIEAEELMRNGGNFIYQFLLQTDGKLLLEGRLTVIGQEAV